MSYWKTLRRVMAALVALTAIAIVANASNEFAVHPAYASTIVQTFKPVADAWVNSTAPDKVSGTGYELQVDGSPVQIAYFNFNLSALAGTVISATLKLSVTSNGSVDGGSVSTVSDTSWTETTLTYNNRPAISAPIVSIGAAPANQAVTVDVTSAVTSSGMLGLAVASTNGDGVSYASRENSLPPLLTVTVGTSTPTSTATNTATATSTTTATSTSTATPTTTATATTTATSTTTATATTTATSTPTATATDTATPTATATATNTATSTPTTTATSTPSPTPTGTPTSTQTFIFRPTADAFANSSAPDTVSGTGFEIPVDGSPDRLDYMTFNVTGLTGTIISATLKLTTTWDGSVDGGSIGKVLDTSWTESTLTYNNRPAISPPSVSVGSIAPYQSVTKDVTAAITGNGPAGFAISSTNSDGVTYASRENTTPPVLTIVTGVFGTPTPTPTATATGTATGTATATATATATDTPTPTATPFSGPVIAAAGDISCDPTSTHYFNGLGDPTHCQQMATSNLLNNMQPTAVLTLGDNQYTQNTLAQFQAVFDGTWGRLKSIIHPAVGNHEYMTANAAGYFTYFGAAAGDPSTGYYSYDIGSWHVITLNSECTQIGGCNTGSPEEVWLKNDLATHSNQCTIAVWHEPEFDSGPNGSGTVYLNFWNDLYRGGADIILNGHSHLYERFAPQTPTGTLDTAHGIVQFTVGTGGEDLDTFHTVRPNSMARDSNDFGVLQLTLGDGGYNWQFVTIPGSSGFTDSGSASCHAAP